jgi:hypothetical protein
MICFRSIREGSAIWQRFHSNKANGVSFVSNPRKKVVKVVPVMVNFDQKYFALLKNGAASYLYFSKRDED